jgi:nucleoside-diphosphate-sugar epimerase
MRILLAGATGAIGRQAVPVLAAAGTRVVVHGVAYADDPAGSPVKDEDAPLWRDPPTPFAPVVAALRSMERRVAAAGGLVLRLGHLYGPGSGFAPDGWFARRLRAGRLPLIGDGTAVFSFIHAHDVAMLGAPAPRHIPAWLARLTADLDERAPR